MKLLIYIEELRKFGFFVEVIDGYSLYVSIEGFEKTISGDSEIEGFIDGFKIGQKVRKKINNEQR